MMGMTMTMTMIDGDDDGDGDDDDQDLRAVGVTPTRPRTLLSKYTQCFCCVRNCHPDWLRPMCPNSRTCQPYCCRGEGRSRARKKKRRDEWGRGGSSSSGAAKLLPGMAFWHPRGAKNVDFSTAGPIVPCKRPCILNILQTKMLRSVRQGQWLHVIATRN